MRGDGCTAHCGFCGACIAGSGHEDRTEVCDHPIRWRRFHTGFVDHDSCRLCGASSSTIAKQRAQRVLAEQTEQADPDLVLQDVERRR